MSKNMLVIPKVIVSNKTLASVEFNEKEIVSAIDLAIHNVENELVTIESIPYIKTQMKSMNDLKDQLKRTRIDTVTDVLVNIEPFQKKLLELFDKVSDARTRLDKQVKWFALVESAYKYDLALNIIEQTKHEIELSEKYIVMIAVSDDYLKANSNPTKVKKLIVEDFKRVKVLQDTEQTKIDTIHMIIGAHNQRLRFKFSFDDFERFINDETPLMELNQIVNDTVNKRLADEKAELERIAEEKKQAVEDERLRVKKEAEEKAEEVRLETERKQRAKLAEIELENKKAIAKVETIRRLEQDKRDREAEIKLQEQEEQTQATLQSVSKELEKMDDIIIVEAKEEDPIVSFKFELSGTAEQIETAKRYFDTFNLKYEELF